MAGTFLASIPVSFVRRGGDCTWRYVLLALRQILAHQTEGDRIVDSSGSTVSAGDAPSSGTFHYVCGGASFYLISTVHVSIRVCRWK